MYEFTGPFAGITRTCAEYSSSGSYIEGIFQHETSGLLEYPLHVRVPAPAHLAPAVGQRGAIALPSSREHHHVADGQRGAIALPADGRRGATALSAAVGQRGAIVAAPRGTRPEAQTVDSACHLPALGSACYLPAIGSAICTATNPSTTPMTTAAIAGPASFPVDR